MSEMVEVLRSPFGITRWRSVKRVCAAERCCVESPFGITRWRPAMMMDERTEHDGQEIPPAMGGGARGCAGCGRCTD